MDRCPFLVGFRPSLDDALERFNMFVLDLFGACFVYFHPVLGIVENETLCVCVVMGQGGEGEREQELCVSVL